LISDGFACKRTIRIEHESNGLTEILPSLVEWSPLGIGTRKLLHEPDVPLRDLPEDGCKCHHSPYVIISQGEHGDKEITDGRPIN